MSKLLPSYNISEYAAEDYKAIETFSKSLYAVIMESLVNNTIQSLFDGLTSITNRYERVSNLLNIQDVNNSKCYYFGYITALSTLGADLAKSNSEDAKMQDLLGSYPLLLPTLEMIDRYDTISGVDLRKKTGQKSSSISNFMHRIKAYKLIDVSKVGTINYYSLTHKGRKFLGQCHQKTSERSIESQTPEKLTLLILDELATQIGKNKPSAIPVLRKANSSFPDFKANHVLKYKIESVFQSRDSYIRKFVESTVVTGKEDLDIEEYEDWGDHYFMVKERDFAELSDASYVFGGRKCLKR